MSNFAVSILQNTILHVDATTAIATSTAIITGTDALQIPVRFQSNSNVMDAVTLGFSAIRWLSDSPKTHEVQSVNFPLGSCGPLCLVGNT